MTTQMSVMSEYPPGVPCWVDTLSANPESACSFYAKLFGWDIAGPGPMPHGGSYYVGRILGHDVAGVGSAPSLQTPPLWTTYVCVTKVDETIAIAERAGATIVAGPFEVEPMGRGAVIAGPAGENIGVWEPRERRGAQLVNAPGAWAMSSLRTSDPERSCAFYGTVFGWTLEWFAFGGGRMGLFRRAGYVGGEEAQPVPRDVVATIVPADVPVATWDVDFWIDDADGGAERARSAGGTILVEPHVEANFRRAVVAAPDGAVLTINQLLAP